MKKKGPNFIEQIIDGDISRGFKKDDLRFRFPPEPNGYLHIGHLKAICLNFNLGEKYGAPVNLRFDDTNPEKEAKEYVDAIKNDILWLGYKWNKECYASDYFEQLYNWALVLIEKDLAYIDSQSSEDIANQKGTPTKEGKASPHRDRDKEESLKVFKEMYNGEHKQGEHVLRAKINMSSPNMLMRDPVIYRVMDSNHHRTGDRWKIYPMYDWTHGESDYIEQVSHSLCTLEFEPHRELYDWFLDSISPLEGIRPKQREFSRLNLSYTITSKRNLAKLVEEGVVDGWDDPRMPTISGMRRRGIPPAAIISFCEKVGVAKRENIIDFALLDYCTREVLNKKAYRLMVVIDPVELEILNYPDEKNELLKAENNPEDESYGHREISFSKNLYIERDDFKEEFNRKYFRLSIGKEVRLKNAYIIKGKRVEKNDSGEIIKIYCTYDPKSKSGSGTEESLRKVKGTIHWIDKNNYEKISVNNYDRLFKVEAPDGNKDDDFRTYLNENSFVQVKNAYAESNIRDSKKENYYQFQRNGYYKLESKNKELTFNRTVTLRDTWKSKSLSK